MIRQARTYLVGALSGVTLIGAAIVVFAVLVSAQVFHDWPIAEFANHHQRSAVAPGKALPVAAGTEAGTGGVTASTGRPNATKATANRGNGNGAANSKPAAHHAGTTTETGAIAAAPTAVTSTEGSGGGDHSSSGGNSGSHPSKPGSGSSPSGSTSGSSGSSGSGGGSSNAPATASTGSSGSGSGGSGSTTATTPPPTTTKPAQTVTEAVNGTVAGVDENVLGGTLEKTGVTEVTENLVNGVAGPESVVGKTVEGVTEAVGGLLGGGGH